MSPSLGPTLAAATGAAVIAALALPAAVSARPTGVSGQRGSTAVVTATARGAAAARTGTPHRSEVPREGRATAVKFSWPLVPRPAVRRGFVRPRSQWSGGHRGVDLVTATGQTVRSAGDGVVAFSGMVAGRGVITVRHPGGLRTSYEPVDQRLASGTIVRRGDRIGLVAPTPGHCTPLACLHWGAILGQTYQDPLSLLGSMSGLGRPVLLPLG